MAKKTTTKKKTVKKSNKAQRPDYSSTYKSLKKSSGSTADILLDGEVLDLRITSLLTKNFISQVISQYALSTLSQVTKAANDPNKTIIERIICKIIIKAFRNEDIVRLEFLLQRCIGKVTDKFEILHEESFATLSIDELKEKHALLSRKNLETIRLIEAKELERNTVTLGLKEYKYNDVDGQDTDSITTDDDLTH